MSNNSTAANEKCENVNINMLVPFRNYPMDRFHGHLLEEVISEIEDNTENNITLEPINVRTLEEGKYEILNGHYYVAAANELGIKTIPVVIHENLNDDKALSLTTFAEPVGLYHRLNIDIFSPNYMESESYKQHKNIEIHLDGENVIALDEYIERFLLTEQEVSKLYKSIYCMGNKYPLSEEECTDDAVAREIVCLTKPDYNNITFSDLMESMNSKEFEDLKFCIDGDAKDLAKIFTRREGYIHQIKKYLNIDLNKYDYEIIQNKRDRAKLLFFIYMIKNKFFPDFKTLEFLSKPALENRSVFVPKEYSNHADFLDFMFHNVEKEISLEKKFEIKNSVSELVDYWGKLELYVYDLICKSNLPLIKIRQVIEVMKKSTEETLEVGFVKGLTPMNLFYLRLVQYPYLGMILDIKDVIKKIDSYVCEVPEKYHEEMKRFVFEKKCMEDLDTFFGTENIQKIAKYVYLKDDISKEDRRKLRNCKEKISRFLDFLVLPGLYDGCQDCDDISDLLIISCLQSIVLDKGNEKFDYAFHGYEGTAGSRKGKQFVQAALKNDEYTYYALRIFWVRRVAYRMHVNTGDGEIKKILTDFEKICLNVLEKLLTCSSVSQMDKMSETYSSRMKCFLHLL